VGLPILIGGAGGVWYAHYPTIHRCAKGDDCKVCGWAQHLCGMPGGRPKARFGASAVVVGAEHGLGRRLKHLGLAIEPFCSSLEPLGHRGTHCRGAVDAIGSSVIRLVIPVDFTILIIPVTYVRGSLYAKLASARPTVIDSARPSTRPQGSPPITPDIYRSPVEGFS